MTYTDPIDMMKKSGGPFTRSLAECYRQASKIGKKILEDGFEGHFMAYRVKFNEWKGDQK